MERGGCIYIMTNKNKTTLYLGVTSNLLNRVQEHKTHKYKNSFTSKYNLELIIYYEFFTSIEEAIAKEKLSNEDLKPSVTADAVVPLVDIRPELFEKALRYLEPTGYGNPNAAFVARNVKVKSARTQTTRPVADGTKVSKVIIKGNKKIGPSSPWLICRRN